MALLNPLYLKSLVAIGTIDKKGKFICNASGFLIGFIAKHSKYPKKRRYWVFLATNRHVFKDKEDIYLRLNKKDKGIEIFREALFFPGSKEQKWLAHRNKTVDLALLNISPKILEEQQIDYRFINEEVFAYYKDFKKIGIEVGDEVYVLGFPLGIAGESQNFPSVRGGIISRLDKEVVKRDKSFWIDSSIFPGSSGSPVVLKPAIHSLGGTPAVSQAYVLGMASKYIPYEENLYTHQTTPYSVVSLERENSGLSLVIPMDFARQIFKKWREEKKKIEKALKQKEQIKIEVGKEEKCEEKQ
ncbi:MAG: serine protease [Candidatus Pacebacteria bacterium]|nr:serine protease [Candidatus Paceibacterota bacterium]